jgi:hypothetical protein
MKKDIIINYQGENIKVINQDDHHVTVHLPNKIVTLTLKEDTEAAPHWFEEGSDNTSEFSKAIGILIEKEMQ